MTLKENNEIISLMEKELKLKGYSAKTIKNYLGHVRRFCIISEKNLVDVCQDDIRKYFLALIDIEDRSHSYISQGLSAVNLLYSKVIKKPEVTFN